MKILLGIAGGIAAYKSAELVRLYRQNDHDVQVILTRSASRFDSHLTLATLTGQPVLCDLFRRLEHIDVAQSAEVVVLAPATAHLLARMAHGFADDLLTTVLLATPAPVVAAPAMNVQMWQHPATQANVDLLRARGVVFVPPAAGYLACGMVGEGRMADLDTIFASSLQAGKPAGAARADLAGERILITAGPTREAIDPVRYLTNRSSGRMGYALAAAARRRGAHVQLVSGPTALTPPAGVDLTSVTTAEEMAAAAESAFAQCTVAILAAAVADYRPARVSAHKLKKTAAASSLELVPTPDILARLGALKSGQRLVGFAAETDPVRALDHARAKRLRKNADLIVLNDVSQPGIGFDAADNEVTLISAQTETLIPRASKAEIADRILDAIHHLPRHVLHHA